MKALVAYFTMGGRTKKMAETIAGELKNYEINYIPIELEGKFRDKMKVVQMFMRGDFTAIENELNQLGTQDYDLIIIGMPTHGGFPPKAFDEILKRLGDPSGKKAIMFSKARFSGEKSKNYMKQKMEEKGANVIAEAGFRGFFRLSSKSALKFVNQIDL